MAAVAVVAVEDLLVHRPSWELISPLAAAMPFATATKAFAATMPFAAATRAFAAANLGSMFRPR